ncbi:MAG: sulfur carrier protein ThiS [Deltaproteobacteria bacterium]|nr:sulfur carrier protein ThiS [Deltaproteobacteria bacterium]
MIITVNGEKKTVVGAHITISELLKLNKVEMPEMVSVQINGSFVDRKEYPSKMITNEDAVDFVYFMGGGTLR